MNQNDKNIWGPIIWNIIHIIGEKYKNYKQTSVFFKIYSYYIPNIIPCKICNNHFVKFIKETSFNSYKYPNNLEYKLYNFHNKVSIRIGNDQACCFECYNQKYKKMCCGEVFFYLKKLKAYYLKSNKIQFVKYVDDFSLFLEKNKKIIFNC